ncbi:hypothetical protein IE53DRAFT_319701 [Violaceomyces palustris]|uniref:Uncharacterized protein n=1 Tax=Violaceomyces palustris TaxID=1673888 RepID=A0ACD0NR83_9BASI|nr:hypothetical protein IE53DRAFT_319701 [Violaceomyces palustris]
MKALADGWSLLGFRRESLWRKLTPKFSFAPCPFPFAVPTALEGQKPGSRDLGDPLTTNLCILNLPANVNEDILGEFFCQWGDVGMVKIMWPRGEEAFGGAGGGITNLRKDRSAGLTGFVAYMRREDAEYALKETDGVRWGDTLIKTGWGKAMPLPSRPTFWDDCQNRFPSMIRHQCVPCPNSVPLRPADMPAKSRKDTHKEVSPSSRHRSSSPALIRHRRRKGDDRSPSPRTVIRSQIEKDETQAKFISTVAARIKEHGQRFEEMIMEREKDNEKFAFLRDENLPDHQYFKMCLNDRYEPMIEPKPFQDAGYDSLYSTDSEEESEAEKMRKLRKVDQIGRVARRRFEAMLRGMTPRRERIAKCMAFAIEHAYAAEAIAEILCRSVTLAETPIPRKLARLHTISDILHNSAAPVPNAWKYRQAFERRLLAVFKHLGEVIGSFPGRMKAEAFKMQVNAVLECWENWLVLTPSHLEDLAKALRSGAAVSRLPPPPPPPPTAPAAGTSSEKVEAALVVEEKNQTTTNNNKNSLSAEEAGGQAKEGEEDLDGEALVLEDDPGQGGGVGEEEEDLDGVAMFDDDLDGKAMQ